MESFGLFLVVFGLVGLAVFGAVNFWLIKNHPDVWHKLNDQAEARRGAWQEGQRQKAAASRERNISVLGFLFKILLGGK